MSNFKVSLPEKRSSWNWLQKYISSVSRYPIEFDTVIATSGNIPTAKLPASRLTTTSYTLPSVLDDANLLYYPFLVQFLLRADIKKYSIVHHLFFSSRGMNSFDIGSLLKLYDNVPFVIGPAEIHHHYSLDDFRLYGHHGNKNSGVITSYRLSMLSGKIASPFLERVMRKVLDRCDRLVVVNERTKELYSKVTSANKIEVIPTGIDTRRFSAINRTMGRPSILMLGNLIERKGYKTAICAMKRLKRDFPDLTMNIVGSGPLESELRMLIVETGLEDSVRIQSKVPDTGLAELFAGATLFCHASYSDSFSQTILEAMSAGLPIVCTDIIGSSGMVENGSNGVIVGPGDVGSLAEAIGKILSDSELAMKMGAESRRRVKPYDWMEVSRLYFRVYESLSQ